MINKTPLTPGGWSEALMQCIRRRFAAAPMPLPDEPPNPAPRRRDPPNAVPQGFWIRGPNREADMLDYFAGCALTGYLARQEPDGYGVTGTMVEACFDDAEAMLTESRKRRAARNPFTPESTE